MREVVVFDYDIGKSAELRRWQILSCRLRGLMGRRLTIAALAAIGFAANFATLLSARADDDPFHKTAGGLSAYIGVMPAAIVKGHPVQHVEATMHKGPPPGRHEYHLVVAVFDDASGQRISDALVKARISELGKAGVELALEPMTIEGVITYGGFVAFPSPTRYAIRVDVAPPNASMVSFDFPYDHRPP